LLENTANAAIYRFQPGSVLGKTSVWGILQNRRKAIAQIYRRRFVDLRG